MKDIIKHITNGERFSTAQERSDEFDKFCSKFESCYKCPLRDKQSFGNCGISCHFTWLDLEAEDDSVVIECNGHRYKAKNAKAHLSGDMLVITGCSGVRGDLSAEIRVEKIEQGSLVSKK